jgi:hypothetical protein
LLLVLITLMRHHALQLGFRELREQWRVAKGIVLREPT